MEGRPVLEEEELWRRSLHYVKGKLKEPVPDAAFVRLANQEPIGGKSVVSLFLLSLLRRRAHRVVDVNCPAPTAE